MTHARDKVYQAVNRQVLLRERIEPGSGSDLDLDFSDLLDQVEDDRAHREAEKLLDMHAQVLLTHGPQVAQGLALAITHIDPYVRRHGDGDQLVRKSDGKPVVPQ